MKKWWMSKTVWVNAIALIASVLHSQYGMDVLTPESQVMMLTGINALLRFITKTEVVFK